MFDFLYYNNLFTKTQTPPSVKKQVQFDLNHHIIGIPSRNDLKPFRKDLFYSPLDYSKFRILEYNRQLESISWRENRKSVLAEKYQDQQPTLSLDTL
jgi:hypothetical protein